MKIYDNGFATVQRAMDLQLRRYQVLASNVANSETPNYRARDLDFSGELERAAGTQSGELRRSHARHMDLGTGDGSAEQAHLIVDSRTEIGADGNTVDLDVQIGKISEATRAYSSAASFLGYKFRMLKQAINSRGA